jgi:excisionase family DNA binding protein
VVGSSPEDASGSAALTPIEVAEQLDVSASSVRRWLAVGTLEGVRVGGRYRVRPQAVERMFVPACSDRGDT